MLAENLAESESGVEFRTIGSRPALVCEGRTLIVTHPLEETADEYCGEPLATAYAHSDKDQEVGTISWFVLSRAPGVAIAQIRRRS